MSGSKKPPTALVRRASPDLSDADLVALMSQRGHLLGRKRLQGTLDAESGPVTLKIHNAEDVDTEASYLIYDESLQRFIGLVRQGAFLMERPRLTGRSRLTFFPAARA